MKLLKTVTQGMSLTHSSLPLITSQNNTLVKAYEAYDLVKGKTRGLAISLQKFSVFFVVVVFFDEQTLIGKLVGISPLLILPFAKICPSSGLGIHLGW